MVLIKRAYEPPAREGGVRILVARLWSRGIKKEAAQIEQWMRELGPSNELRRSFGHDPARRDGFRRRYRAELQRPEARPLLESWCASRVTSGSRWCTAPGTRSTTRRC